MGASLKEQLFQNYAKQIMEGLYRSDERTALYQELLVLDSGMKTVSSDAFQGELFCAQLALYCLSWQALAVEFELKEDPISKALLRTVLGTFESPKSIEPAAKFGDYFQAPHIAEQEEGVSVILAAKLWQRLRSEKSPVNESAFRRIVENFETLRIEFENQFMEFITEATFPKHNE